MHAPLPEPSVLTQNSLVLQESGSAVEQRTRHWPSWQTKRSGQAASPLPPQRG
jgi:hypothetical protein